MKILLLVFFMCASTFCVTTDFSFLQHKLDIEALQKAIQNKWGSDRNMSIEHVMDKFRRCMARSLDDQPNILFNPFKNSTDYCIYFSGSQFRTCIKDFVTDISLPFTENEMYLQELLLNVVDVGYEELCGTNGVSNAQYLYSKANQTMECMPMCGFTFLFTRSCTTNLNIFKDLDKGLLHLEKHDICVDLNSLQECSKQLFEGLCNEEYSRFTDLIYRPFLESCSDDLNENKSSIYL